MSGQIKRDKFTTVPEIINKPTVKVLSRIEVKTSGLIMVTSTKVYQIQSLITLTRPYVF